MLIIFTYYYQLIIHILLFEILYAQYAFGAFERFSSKYNVKKETVSRFTGYNVGAFKGYYLFIYFLSACFGAHVGKRLTLFR